MRRGKLLMTAKEYPQRRLRKVRTDEAVPYRPLLTIRSQDLFTILVQIVVLAGKRRKHKRTGNGLEGRVCVNEVMRHITCAVCCIFQRNIAH